MRKIATFHGMRGLFRLDFLVTDQHPISLQGRSITLPEAMVVFMSVEQMLKKTFPALPFYFGCIAVLLLVYIVGHLFFRSIGGPFPYRTRGPLAKQELYQLGEMPVWENAIRMTELGKTTSELLLEGQNSEMPPLQFGEPPQAASTEIQSTTPKGN